MPEHWRNVCPRTPVLTWSAPFASITPLRGFLQDNIRWALANHADHADAHLAPAPRFKSARQGHARRAQPTNQAPGASLGFKNRGLFFVIRFANDIAYELLLPREIGLIHTDFHPWLFHLYEEEPVPSQEQATGHVTLKPDDEEYHV